MKGCGCRADMKGKSNAGLSRINEFIIEITLFYRFVLGRLKSRTNQKNHIRFRSLFCLYVWVAFEPTPVVKEHRTPRLVLYLVPRRKAWLGKKRLSAYQIV